MSLRIDVATGEAVLREVDLRLPGYIPLELARVYRSGYPPGGMLGHGWRFNLDIALHLDREVWSLQYGSGKVVRFKPVQVGVQVTQAELGMVLQHHPNEYVVYASPLVQMVFPKRYAQRGIVPLGQLEDLGGNKIQFFYQGNRLMHLVDTVGREIKLLYTGANIGGIQLRGPDRSQPPLTQRAFRYDGRGDLIEVQDAVGRRKQYQYRDHLLVAAVNPMGGTECVQYGEDKRCHTRWDTNGGKVRQFAYDDGRQAVHVMDSEGRRTVYICMMNGQVLSRTTPNGFTQHFYYNEAQQPLGYTDLVGNIAMFVHADEKGSFTRIQSDTFTKAELDERGLATTWMDARGIVYHLTYDAQGRLFTQAVTDETTWRYERDSRGRITALHTPEERRIRFRSEEGALVIEDELGLCLRERYDLMGRTVERHDALGRQQQWQYDGEGRLLRYGVVGGFHLICNYNPGGQLTSVQDAEGRKATLQYDAHGRLQASKDEEGHSWRYGYDREGKVTQIQDQRGGMASLTYDAEGHLLHVEGWNGQGARFARSGEETVVTVDDQGLKQEWHYGGLGAPLTQQTGEQEGPHFIFDNQGSLAEASLPGATWTWAYDEQGNLASLQRNDVMLSFSFTRDGQLAAVMDEAGNGVQLLYDPRGRVQEVLEENNGTSTARHRLRYDEGNRLKVLTLDSSAFLTIRYDMLDRVTERSLFSPERTRQDHKRGTSRELETPWRDQLTVSEGESRLVLLQNVYGLVLVIELAGIRIPVWSQYWLLAPPPLAWEREVEISCLRGEDGLLKWGGQPALLEMPARCHAFAGAAWPAFAGDLPSVDVLSRYLPVLPNPMLSRADYDPQFPGLVPGIEEGEQVTLPSMSDDCITGTHEAGRPSSVSRKGFSGIDWLCPSLAVPNEAARNGSGLLRLLKNLNAMSMSHAG